MAIGSIKDQPGLEAGRDGQRQSVFISHANPEDNVFAAWLSAKLSLIGYAVWCDLQAPVGGEQDFWRRVESQIRERTAKFIFLVSKTSLSKDGAMRELAIADGSRVGTDFVIAVRVDDTNFKTELPAELIRSIAIDARTGWANALRQLERKLVLDGVPVTRSDRYGASRFWLEGHRLISNTLTQEGERHWTNWFGVDLPDTLYARRDGDSIVGKANQAAAQPLCARVAGWTFSLEPIGSADLALSIRDLIGRVLSLAGTADIEYGDCRTALIQIMNGACEESLRRKGLAVYEQAGHRLVFFHMIRSKVGMRRFGRQYKFLSGRYGDLEWHYGMSVAAALSPFPRINVRSHVIFTQQGKPIEVRKQHSARRRLCKRWYNNQWRDLLLAGMVWLSDDEGANEPYVTLWSGGGRSMLVRTTPVALQSAVGFIEPSAEDPSEGDDA